MYTHVKLIQYDKQRKQRRDIRGRDLEIRALRYAKHNRRMNRISEPFQMEHLAIPFRNIVFLHVRCLADPFGAGSGLAMNKKQGPTWHQFLKRNISKNFSSF